MFGSIRRHFQKTGFAVAGATPGRTGLLQRLRAFLAAHPKSTMWLASSMTVAGLLTLFALELRSEYTATISNAERASQSFADVIAEHTARTFEAVERTLRVAETIRSDVQAGRTTQQAANLALRGLQRSSPATIAIGWTNEAGDVIAHSYQGDAVRPNIADLPHFIAQKNGKSEEMYIAPLYRSKASQSWISSVSIRLSNADGSFAGVVSAPLDTSYFARTYRSVNMASDNVITVVSTEGEILFREPFSEQIIGRSLKNTSLFLDRLPKSPSGTFLTKSPIDGRERVFAYHAVPGLPLVILVLQDRTELLTRWYEHIRTFGPLVTFLTLIIILGTAVLSRRTAQLTEKSTLLEATLNNMHEGLIVVDRTDRIAVCNRRAMELLDLPEKLMTSRPLSKDVIDYQTQQGEFVDASEEVKARVHPRLFGETTNAYERRRPNGNVIEVLTVPFANGGTIRTYKDITNWKKIEKELKDGEMRYRLLAENATDMIFTLDSNFVRQYVSPASQEILGYLPEELVRTKPLDMVHPDDADHVEATYQTVIDGLSRASVTNRIRHRDGRWIWVEVELRLVRDSETRLPVGILGALRDISVRKALEEETAEARKQAETAAEVQAQFLATMSHELRTPLNSIVGFADIVLDRNDLAPAARRQIGHIQTASETLLTVVNDVLDFSKIEEGKLGLESIAFDFRASIDSVIAIVRGSAEAKNLELRVSIDPRIAGSLSGDDQRIRQILLNLLNNGIKFTQEGQVSIVAEVAEQDETTQQLQLSILDTGIGIPQNKLGQLFQRFSQVDSSTSRHYGGTGLGLAISKRLVEMMGGTIGVESVPGKGSTFWFRLNLPKAIPPQADVRLSGVVTPHPMSAHILLVEDVEVNREIACSILEGLGYHVDVVPDGADAIISVQSHRYDLVLMDVQMPGMDGLTATRKIRALDRDVANIPIVAMTANVLLQQIEATRSAGMNGHVGKPFKREELKIEIERCLLQAKSEPRFNRADEPRCGTIDEESIATLTDILGANKVCALFKSLQTQLELFSTSDATSVEAAELAARAHRLVSSAGMLGFTGVSKRCALFEREVLDEPRIDVMFEQVREICLGAMAEISLRLSRYEAMSGPESKRA